MMLMALRDFLANKYLFAMKNERFNFKIESYPIHASFSLLPAAPGFRNRFSLP